MGRVDYRVLIMIMTEILLILLLIACLALGRLPWLMTMVLMYMIVRPMPLVKHLWYAVSGTFATNVRISTRPSSGLVAKHQGW